MKLPFLSAVSLAIAQFSMAGTIVSSCSIPTSTAPINASCVLNTYQTVAGQTLTGITLSEAFTTTADIAVYNTTASIQPFGQATAVIPFTVQGPTGVIFSFASSAGPVSGFAAASPPPTVVAAPATVSTSSFVVAPGSWALWTNPPTTSVNLLVSSENGIYSGTAIPGVFFGGTASAFGTLSVTYTFTGEGGPNTPEPATMAMLGGGLLLIGWRLKRS